jgi:hypothetical protein
MDTTRYTGWIGRFDQEMAQGKVAAALVTSMYGLDLASPAFKRMPRPQAEALTNMAMDSEDKQAASDTVTMRKLAPTLRWEGMLLAEMAGTIGTFADVPAEGYAEIRSSSAGVTRASIAGVVSRQTRPIGLPPSPPPRRPPARPISSSIPREGDGGVLKPGRKRTAQVVGRGRCEFARDLPETKPRDTGCSTTWP